MGGSWDAYLEGRLSQQLHLSKGSLPVLLSQLALLFSSIVAMRSRTAIMPEILRHGSTVAAFRPCKLPDQHARHLVKTSINFLIIVGRLRPLLARQAWSRRTCDGGAASCDGLPVYTLTAILAMGALEFRPVSGSSSSGLWQLGRLMTARELSRRAARPGWLRSHCASKPAAWHASL